MTIDLDELERKAKDGWEGLNDDLSPRTILALIERVRAAEIVGSECMALQEAAGFPKDGMVRSVKDVSDSVVLMAERLRELEKQCAENAAFAQKALEREVLGRSRIAKLEAAIRLHADAFDGSDLRHLGVTE